jgi:methylphosphotriester-DNA--protein-cysteine methyltransferase
MAPPTKATQRVLSEPRFALEMESTLREAASIAGVSVRTLHRWIKRGFRAQDDAYAHMRALVHAARRLDPVVVVQTPKGLALRRAGVRRRSTTRLVRDLEAAHASAVAARSRREGETA